MSWGQAVVSSDFMGSHPRGLVAPEQWVQGLGSFLPAHSDQQLHYTIFTLQFQPPPGGKPALAALAGTL